MGFLSVYFSLTDATEINADGELVITYSNGQTANLGTVVGANGMDGIAGSAGADGADGVSITKTEINANGELVISYSDGTTSNAGKVTGADGNDGVGVAKSEINAAGELVLTYTNGTTANLGIVVGSNGRDGIDGTNGVDGTDGVGISSAEVSADGELVLAFSNNTTVNLGCIVGKNGADGANGKDGSDGAKGTDGVGIADVTISAEGVLSVKLTNDTTLNLGNVKGADGIGISASAINEDGELVLTYTNGNSTNLGKVVGSNGTNGTDGKNGTDGVGISDVTITDAGVLNVTLTNGSVINLGHIKGADGNGISKSEIVGGELVLTYTDGTTANLGKVVGSNGTNGTPGKDGTNGVGIQSVTVSDDGQLVVTLTDGSVQIAGSVKGDKGDKGDQGEQGVPGAQGPQGEQGIQGVDGKSAYELYKEAYPDYTGTMEDWLASLKGETGADGIGITKAEIIDGNLWITYSNKPESPVNVGQVISSTVGKNSEGLIFYPLPDGNYAVSAGTTEYLTEIEIPATYNGKAVTIIHESGFAGLPNLKKLTLPSTITTIEADAFLECSNLESVYYGGTVDSWTQITFSNANANPTSNTVDLYIGDELLTEATFSESISVINSFAFYGYKNLTGVKFPAGLTRIGKSAFCGTGLSEVTLPDSLTYLGAYAFYDSTLTSVTFPYSGKNWEIGGIRLGSSSYTLWGNNDGGSRLTGRAKDSTDVFIAKTCNIADLSDPSDVADFLLNKRTIAYDVNMATHYTISFYAYPWTCS